MNTESFNRMAHRKPVGILALILSIAVLVFATACSKNSNNSNGSSSSSGTSSSSTTSKTSTGSTTGMSPTEVFKAYYDAAIKRDFATAKQYLSKRSEEH